MRGLISILLVLGPTFFFGISTDAGKMGIAAAAGAAAAMLLNVDRLKYLKLGIMEAQLQEKIQEANATLAALQELASASLAVSIQTVSRYGRWGGRVGADKRVAAVNRLLAVAEGLEIENNEEIRDAVDEHRRLTAFDRFSEFQHELSREAYAPEVMNRLGGLLDLQQNKFPGREEILEVFGEVELRPDDQRRLDIFLAAREAFEC